MRPGVLVVSPDPDLASGVREVLRRTDAPEAEPGPVVASLSGEAAIQELARTSPELLVVRQDLPGMSGLELVRTLRDRGVEAPMVLVVERESLELAIRSLGEGADDFLVEPVPEWLLEKVVRARLGGEEHDDVVPLRPSSQASAPDRIVGWSPAIVEVCRRVGRVATTEATVLLSGESGTGKELVARLIHQNSPRSDGPFKALNCAALPDNLLETELFGHEKGAFTGADDRRMGKFEAAGGGTIFLDEVGEMSQAHQRKILRTLEERTVERVGGHRRIEVDVRVVAATNVDLWSRVQAGEFRRDLYYRLAVVLLHLPPLRERPEDVRPLTNHFVARFARRTGRGVTRVAAGVYERLLEHDWPGNVRELRNVLERAVIMGHGPVLRVEDLPDALPGEGGNGRKPRPGTLLRRFCREGVSLEDLERRYIRSVLEEMSWHFGRAAERLQIHRNTLRRKMRRYDLEEPAS